MLNRNITYENEYLNDYYGDKMLKVFSNEKHYVIIYLKIILLMYILQNIILEL